MKKVYLFAVAAVFTSVSMAQINEQGVPYVKGVKSISPTHLNAKTPTDTLGWTPQSVTDWAPAEFAAGGQVWNYGYTGGGYVYGTNISTNDISHVGQGYLNLQAATIGVEGIIISAAGKDYAGTGTGTSTFDLHLYNMAPNSAYTHDGTSWNQDAIGPNGAAVASITSQPISGVDTAWFPLTYYPFASVIQVNGDFAVTFDPTAVIAASDTIGLLSDTDGEGANLAFHKAGVNNNWYVTSSLIGNPGLNNNIAIFPVIDANFVGINDDQTYNGMKLSAFPNPAVDQTTISYSLETSMNNVKLIVYDLTGKEILREEYGNQAAGLYNINLDVSELNAGNYFYSLIGNGSRLTKRMVVVK